MAFSIRRGTNISHWLSQSPRRGDDRTAWFTQDDVKRIADWGFDHIRLPIDEEQMWDAGGKQEPQAWKLLDSALQWCQKVSLRVIVDLHILRSHYFNQTEQPRLFTDPAEAQRFADLWQEISTHLHGWPADQVAYELMNEAVAKDAKDWNRVAMLAYSVIRKSEPGRMIVLGSNRWNAAATFDELAVPDDPNTILTFHFYHPMLITHHQANWWRGGGEYAGPIHYPGVPVAEADLKNVPESIRPHVLGNNKPYGRQQMVEDIAKPLAVRTETGLALYCGEFGCINRAPQPIRLAWYRDMISVFDEYGIAWANWDYKGGFGLVDGRTNQSTGIADALLGR